MREKVIFVADDGTEFDHEDECRNYECFEEVRPAFENVQLWDDCEDPIAIPGNYQEMVEALEAMHYAKGDVEAFIDTIYGNDMEHNMLDYHSFRDEAPNANPDDLLMYDGDRDFWVNVNYEFEQYRKILKMFGNRG